MAHYEPITVSPWRDQVVEQPGRIYVKPGAGDEFPELSFYVEAMKPRKRDFWRVLRGKYKPMLTTGRRTNMRYMDAWLRWTWRPEASSLLLEKRLFLHALDEKEKP